MAKSVTLIFEGFTEPEIAGMYEMIDLHCKDYEAKDAVVYTESDSLDHLVPRAKRPV